MTTPNPEWDKLPGDPVTFFGLPPGYERKALKSAYTKLIRVYKPERHPEEFKLIRAAFDFLNDQLRFFGSSTESVEDSLEQSESPSAEPESASPTIDVLAIFKKQGALTAVNTLRAAPILGGVDWCQLALLEDVLEKDPLKFQRTLIEGIQQSSEANETFQLLLSSLQEELSAKEQATLVNELLPLVRETGSPLQPGVYWYLSEALWIGLVQKVKFAEFAQLFERCTLKVGEDGWSARVVLLLRLVRKAAFAADDEWLAKSMRELGDAYYQLTPWDQRDLDVLEWLIAYRYQRPDLVDAHPLIGRIDSALVAIVTGDEVQADRLFLEAQMACLDWRDDLLALFPQEAYSGIVVDALQWYAEGVAERSGDESWAEDEESMRDAANRFANRLMRNTRRSPTAILRWMIRPWLIAIVACVLLVPWIVLAVSEDIGGLWWSVPILVTVGVILGFARGWFARADAFFQAPFVRRLHRRVWRDLTADFLAESHIPLGIVVSEIAQVQEHAAAIAYCSEAVHSDEGLQLYSIAQQFAE